MKALIIFLSFVVVAGCVTSRVKTRAVASEGCNIENYKDFINKEGFHSCDLREADLRLADLREADLYKADLYKVDLRGAGLTGAKVTQDQAEYLRSRGLSGFVVVE